MVSLPPPTWADLFYSGTWNDIGRDLRATSTVTITRGLSSESSSAAEPTSCECVLDSRGYKYAPRAPQSALYDLIGRNTGFRFGYEVGSPWAEFPGGYADYNSLFVNDNAALDIAGDFDLRLEVALEDWSEQQMLALRYIPSGNECWALEILDGVLTFIWSPDGTFANRIDRAATETLHAYNGQRLTVRVTLAVNNGAGGYELRFYTGRTVDDTEWNLLGDPIVGGATTSVFAGSAYMEVGGGFTFNSTPAGGVLNRMRGKAYALQLRDGIGGAVKVDMNTRNATPGGTTFVDDTGLTWSRGGTGVVFTNKHVRMSGEVPAWPPTRDLSGNDNYVSINPSGITRRMDAGNKPQDSALLRFIKENNPIACWPMTDGPAAPAFKSLTGGSDMQQEVGTGSYTAVEKAAGSLAEWVEPVISVKANTAASLSASTPRTTGTDAFWSFDIFLSGCGPLSSGTLVFKDRGAGTDDDNRVELNVIMTSDADQLSLLRASYGTDSSSTSLLATINDVGIYDQEPHHIRLSIDPQASNSIWYLYVDGALVGNGTITSIVVKSLRSVLLVWGFQVGDGMTDRACGYFTYWDGNGPTAAQMWDAYTGFPGEKAGDRIERLATEAGYTATVAGESVFQQPMGIQGRKKLLELFNEASRTNFGYLLDARDRIEVIHRGQSTLWNQPPSLVLDFKAGLISAPFKPVDGDKLTENDVSVQREYGSIPAREVLEEGKLSVQDPEDGGVGRYDNAYTYSLETDAQAAQVAGMRVHLGTYDGVRYTRVTIDLANPRVFQMIDDILRIDVGDKLRLTDLPDDHGPDDVDVLVNGYTEEVGPDVWKITFNCVPGQPWTAGIVDVSLADIGGAELAEALDASETAADVFTTGEYRWTNAAPALNSNSTFDSGITGWVAFGGATIAWDPVRGRRTPGCIAVTTGGASTPRTEGARVAVSPNKQYVISGWLSTDAVLGVAANVSVNWYTALSGGSYISTSNATLATLPSGGWVWVQAIVTAPATALGGAVLTSLTGTPASGLTWRGDELEIRDYVPDTYTDGFPFDVRTGGEVMRVTAATPAVWDTFTRSATDSWGTANVGGSWTNTGGAGADYDVTGSAGTHSLTSVNVSRYSVIPAPSKDVDLVVDAATSALAAGGPQYVGLVARFTDTNNLYYARAAFNTDQTITLVLQKRVGGTQTDLASVTVPYTHAASTLVRIRFQVIGSALRAKVWDAAGPEPVVWQVTDTDTALTAVGSVGVRSILSSANTNTLPVTVSYDNFGVLNPQTFTVNRSVNGVQKSHAAGQDIRLATPVYVAL